MQEKKYYFTYNKWHIDDSELDMSWVTKAELILISVVNGQLIWEHSVIVLPVWIKPSTVLPKSGLLQVALTITN